MLDIMLASSTVLCIYTHAVCSSDNDGAVVKLTVSRHPSSLFYFGNAKPSDKIRFSIGLLCQHMLLC